MCLPARRQRALLHRHPWLARVLSHLQPLGPASLGVLEWALAVLEPTGLAPAPRLETFSLINGFIASLVRAEMAGRAPAALDEARAAAQMARLQELLATGRYPRFAAAVAEGGPPAADQTAHFERLLDRVLDGLVQPVTTPGTAPR